MVTRLISRLTFLPHLILIMDGYKSAKPAFLKWYKRAVQKREPISSTRAIRSILCTNEHDRKHSWFSSKSFTFENDVQNAYI